MTRSTPDRKDAIVSSESDRTALKKISRQGTLRLSAEPIELDLPAHVPESFPPPKVRGKPAGN
jgi:hypothetical protein